MHMHTYARTRTHTHAHARIRTRAHEYARTVNGFLGDGTISGDGQGWVDAIPILLDNTRSLTAEHVRGVHRRTYSMIYGLCKITVSTWAV